MSDTQNHLFMITSTVQYSTGIKNIENNIILSFSIILKTKTRTVFCRSSLLIENVDKYYFNIILKTS